MATTTAHFVHTEEVMGTVVSFTVCGDADAAPVVRAACDSLHEADRRFSPYRHDSIISRLDRGELLVADAGEDVEHVLGACAELHRESHGAFDVRATGRLDPSAYVKGWATQRAALILEDHGLRHFQVNAGGDIVVRGDAGRTGGGWRIGIRHPLEPRRLAAVVRLRDAAVATSARYERGPHIVAPHHDKTQPQMTSVTVVAEDLGWADGWATALFAAGSTASLALLESRPDITALLVTGETVSATAGFPQD